MRASYGEIKIEDILI